MCCLGAQRWVRCARSSAGDRRRPIGGGNGAGGVVGGSIAVGRSGVGGEAEDPPKLSGVCRLGHRWVHRRRQLRQGCFGVLGPQAKNLDPPPPPHGRRGELLSDVVDRQGPQNCLRGRGVATGGLPCAVTIDGFPTRLGVRRRMAMQLRRRDRVGVGMPGGTPGCWCSRGERRACRQSPRLPGIRALDPSTGAR